VGIQDELLEMGYEYDDGYGNMERRAEVWVNRKTGTGILVEWFHLAEAAR